MMQKKWYAVLALVLTALLCAGIAAAEKPELSRVLSPVEDAPMLDDVLVQENSQGICATFFAAEAEEQTVDDCGVLRAHVHDYAAVRIFTIDDALGNAASPGAANSNKIPLTLR